MRTFILEIRPECTPSFPYTSLDPDNDIATIGPTSYVLRQSASVFFNLFSEKKKKGEMMGVLSSFVGGSFTRVLWLAARSVRAFTPTLPTNSAQCEPYTLSWTLDAAGDRAGPPFTLLIVPVNPPNAPNSNSTGLTGANVSPPSLVSIPDSAWNATTNTGTYSLSALPLRTGERFLIVMDDGFGVYS